MFDFTAEGTVVVGYRNMWTSVNVWLVCATSDAWNPYLATQAITNMLR